tara:strand:+ start:173 stop:769 length:597 start_codon:yes stop_codon:yes gene_type:complete
MKLHKALLAEQSIQDLIKSYVASMKKNSMMRQERYKSMIYARLADLGFSRHNIMKMVNDLDDITTEKDVDSFMARYKLLGDDFIDSFRATESSITESEREEVDGIEENIHTFDLILQIPFTTEKNKEEKIRKLKFDFAINDIKINSQKEFEVDKVNPDSETNPVIDYVVRMEIETEMTRSQLENEIEPDYKILKIKEK